MGETHNQYRFNRFSNPQLKISIKKKMSIMKYYQWFVNISIDGNLETLRDRVSRNRVFIIC